jgi:hypothetical protein
MGLLAFRVTANAAPPAPLADPVITQLKVTLNAMANKGSGTTGHLWLIVSVKTSNFGGSDGGVVYLGEGLAAGQSRTFTVKCPRGDFTMPKCGGLSLVNGRNGNAPDLQIDSVRVEGIEPKGGRWLIAQWTIQPPNAWRRWLKNDPVAANQGPVLPISTLGEWQKL